MLLNIEFKLINQGRARGKSIVATYPSFYIICSGPTQLSVKPWLGRVVTTVANDATRSVPQWVIEVVSRTTICIISS